MISHIKKSLKPLIELENGNKLFLIGIFFLPSAFPIGAIFLLISLFISISKNKEIILKDRWNYPLFLCMGIILISTINISIFNSPYELEGYKKSIIWINLFNWIPIFLGFMGFQFYLQSYIQRESFAKVILIGTIPVIYSCFNQYNLGLYGPFETLNSLIVWFQYPIRQGGGVSGLFSNQNYLACWLSISMPFIFLFLKTTKDKLIKVFLIFCLFIYTYYCLLTSSRNALISLILIYLFYFGIKRLLIFALPVSFLIVIGNSIFTSKKLLISIIDWISTNSLTNKLFNNTFDLQTNLRIKIWEKSIEFISEKPFLGWGASTFSHLNFFHRDRLFPDIVLDNAQHTHNIILELAYNFGIPLSILLTTTIIIFLIKVFNKLRNFENNYQFQINKAWFFASFLIVLVQINDVTYYDGKISLIFCILFAGSRSILTSST